MSDANPSPLARALTRLLDETGMFDREHWSYLLGETEEELCHWCADRYLPGRGPLRMIVDVLEGSSCDSEGPLAEWRSIVDRPAAEVTPFAGQLMAPTLRAFMEHTVATMPRQFLVGKGIAGDRGGR